MGVIEQFLARYRKEYDHYSAVARLSQSLLESALASAGIRAMVTSRAKEEGRLEQKIRSRNEDAPYVAVEEIFDKIVDLAGVRVALYFPGDTDRAGKIIEENFDLQAEGMRKFPQGNDERPGKRFSGYSATHYRVTPKKSILDDSSLRYAATRIEIQVASVLMHAWAEVEHDLGYKPPSDPLSEQEQSILDQLNGMVIAGEIALEQLQRAGELRVSAANRRFSNQYDLAAHLLSKLAEKSDGTLGNTGAGRVDDLLELITELDLNTPSKIAPYLLPLHDDLETRPLADQVIDGIIAGDDDRARKYLRIGSRRTTNDVSTSQLGSPGGGGIESKDGTYHLAVGRFLHAWATLEQRAASIYGRRPNAATRTSINRKLEVLKNELETPLYEEMLALQTMRNGLVHGAQTYNATSLESAANLVEAILRALGNAG
jgi:ppGpp synthetase/RelA/SpoT-type nucleotidyltranferase